MWTKHQCQALNFDSGQLFTTSNYRKWTNQNEKSNRQECDCTLKKEAIHPSKNGAFPIEKPKKQHLYKNKQVTGSLRHAICEMLRHKI